MRPHCIKCGARVHDRAHYSFDQVDAHGAIGPGRWALCINCGLEVRVFIGEHPSFEDQLDQITSG